MTINAKYGEWPSERSEKWRRMAREAISESRRAIDATHSNMRDVGDPNHPNNDGLFGYATADFLSMQMK